MLLHEGQKLIGGRENKLIFSYPSVFRLLLRFQAEIEQCFRFKNSPDSRLNSIVMFTPRQLKMCWMQLYI